MTIKTASLWKQIKTKYNNLVWIEVGVNKGNNAAKVFKECSVKKIFLIDPYDAFPDIHAIFKTKDMRNSQKKQAKNKLSPFDDRCVWLEMTSDAAAEFVDNASADVVYIDGNHSYEFVLSDLNNYYRKAKPGGLIVLDDYGDKMGGVKKAVIEFTENNDLNYIVTEDGKTAYFEVKNNG